jgi:flagellar hook protein FlgE
MASTTALFTGLTGLTANSRNLDVIGNNIANVNTTAFKSNRMLFANQFSRTFSIGTVPGDSTGGTNPGQVGLGVAVAGTQRDFSSGALSNTGDSRDLAIEGNGFFIVQRGDAQFYTRAGAFRSNAQNDLVNISGERLRGYTVDSNFNIETGRLVDLNIPVGTLTLAEQTRTVRFAGNLNSGGQLPTQGSRHTLGTFDLLTGPVGGDALQTGSLLTDIQDPAAPGNPLYTAGQILEVAGARKGSTTLPTSRFTIASTSTVQDLMDFLGNALGIDASVGNNPDGRTPGVSLDPTTGTLTVTGNVGSANDLDLRAGDFVLKTATGTTIGGPLTPTREASADGESVRNTFVVFDSLGTPLTVNLTMVLEGKSNSGTTWRYFADSPNDTRLTKTLGTGTIAFDTLGQLTGAPSFELRIERQNTGAATPLGFALQFSSTSDNVTALADQSSTIAATFQDGTPLGTLASYSVGSNGVITGAFTNGLTRTVGQVALATFSNAEGLVDAGGNLYRPGPNSGTPVVSAPLELGAGRIIGGALELSNVDLSQEFINLILASTGYSASSRVITTTDQLMQQLLVLGR